MFGKSKADAVRKNGDIESAHEMQRPTIPAARAAEAMSSISSGLSVIGKITGHGAVTIFGHVEGELQASTVVIAEGAQVLGDVIAEELIIAGRVEGTIHANRIKLNSTAVVEGDILHRSLVIEENARFEGVSRRLEEVIDTSSHIQTNDQQPHHAGSIDGNGKANGASSALNL